ncbi:hydroxycinnamoyltransferase [Andrographis paniculata]|uniref:hydroxycinnamoyltransferase n=1 Tax=Andrographis paniculata TaxID=175694 RepID=UPI0021E7FC5A|nr:hydroxycinnamoyltransferase [Andrographis paniculata]
MILNLMMKNKSITVGFLYELNHTYIQRNDHKHINLEDLNPYLMQINNFLCGGLALGLSCSHMHADITSAALFIKSWSDIHGGLPLSHPPIYHLPPPPTSTPTPTTPAFHLSPVSTTPSKMSSLTMRFSGQAIDRCLSEVQVHYPSVESPFEVLAALFWSRVARLQERLTSTLPSPRTLSICLDMRSWGGSGVPCAYFGNALHFSNLNITDDCLLNGGIGAVSDEIRRHVEGVKKGDDVWSAMQWLEDSHGKEVREGRPFRIYAPRLTCISAENTAVDVKGGKGMMMYTAVFNKNGMDTAAHVSCRVGNVEGEGTIVVMPLPEGGRGRTVTVALPEEMIGELSKDPVIMELEPKMVMSGGIKN